MDYDRVTLQVKTDLFQFEFDLFRFEFEILF